METVILKLAMAIFKQYAKDWEAYERDCEASWKLGYRPRHCFHGVNLWTDYDPICGPCEDGYGWFDRTAYRQLALLEAKTSYKMFEERLAAYVKASTLNAPLDHGAMIDWVNAPLARYGLHHQAVALEAPF